MLDDNFFADFFSKYTQTPDSYSEKLNEYWERGKIREYYDLLNQCKEQHKVMRNSSGKHRVEKR